MQNEPDPLAIQCGLIVAPAGCGKTHTIVSALQYHRGAKPVLVLTHTNAGVAALRRRLSASSVPRAAYRLATIDGWAMRLVATFPMRSGSSDVSVPPRPNYPKIRDLAAHLLHGGHIARILAASYDRLVVDEYQDCSTRQHRIVSAAANSLPTVALGDPLQAIFSFDHLDPLPDWSSDVVAFFPHAGELSQPWRWRNADNEQLGSWLTDVRASLLDGRGIDLRSAPSCVHWVPLRGKSSDHSARLNAAKCLHRKSRETALLIGSSKSEDSRRRVARSVPGVVMIEPVDLRTLTDFADRLERAPGRELFATLTFASQLMANLNQKEVLRRVTSLQNGRARKPPDDLERAALALSASPDLATVAGLLDACRSQTGTRLYRPEVYSACLQSIRLSLSHPGLSLREAAIRVREQRRSLGRRLPTRGIGSTLLLKGLESDHAVLLDVAGLDANNLYVALTRASRTIAVCSRSPKITPLSK